ncbi:hypothetical protein SAMN05421642_108147 [Rhodococcoides kyotonense]|uniref:Uncharacterized protein n=2 Tax=Rhodococcoides kyotonense TaxID=398843 RepID=A0A239JB91_9NOCA|nr:hypothetical protein SAMN05421642_108147 [Rhodococcus kyotonensis]
MRDADLGREIGIALDRCFARIRVQISGRVGVGKSSVRAVLEARGSFDEVDVTEAAAIDVPRSPDPILDGDVVVHVLASGAQAADVEVLRSVPTAVAVLAKADTVADVPGTIARLTATVGIAVLPLMGTIARSVSEGEPSSFADLRVAATSLTEDMLLTPERFELAASDAVVRRQRRDLVERIELAGVRTLVAALSADPTVDDASLRRMLADVSGVEHVVDAVGRRVGDIRVDREGRLLHRLTELCVQYPSSSEAVEEYLSTDDAVLTIMRSALRALNEVQDPGPPLDAAVEWHRRAEAFRDPDHRRAAGAISRGYLRLRAS